MDNNEINAFIVACNELIEGKFILADIKIAKILRAISSSNEIYNLIAESMINYDFNREYEKIRQMNQEDHSGYMQLPRDNQVIIPFVFSLLVEIDCKHLDFSEFLSQNFPISNNQKEEYDSFARHIVLPFRNAIAEIFGVNVKLFAVEEEPEEVHILDTVRPENREEAEVEAQAPAELTEKEETALLFDSIARVCGLMREKLDYIRKDIVRSNISLIVDALIEACYLRNKTIAVALIMSLGEIGRREKAIKDDIDEISSICYEFYA